MCGRYALYDTSKSSFKIIDNLVGKNYNVTPGATVPVVLENNEITFLSWGFKIPWNPKRNIINARSETLESRIVFKNMLRCIFIANGYFEWLRKDKAKIPYYHSYKNQMMYFAGIFNDRGACIVTRESYQRKTNVHHRQPVLLQYNEFASWFASKHDYNCEYSRDMVIHEVSSLVNSPKNNSLKNIERVKNDSFSDNDNWKFKRF